MPGEMVQLTAYRDRYAIVDIGKINNAPTLQRLIEVSSKCPMGNLLILTSYPASEIHLEIKQDPQTNDGTGIPLRTYYDRASIAIDRNCHPAMGNRPELVEYHCLLCAECG